MENLENKRNSFKMELYKNNFEDVISLTQHFMPKSSDFYLSYQQNMIVNTDCDDFDIIFKKALNTKSKLLPEERIALFRKTMELFVYPLRVAMNDIINKCTNLGIYDLLRKSQININAANDNNYNYAKNTCKSNRMVYSIIFDE